MADQEDLACDTTDVRHASVLVSIVSPPELLSQPQYRHSSLDATKQEIRLVRLHKDKDGPIRCEINTFELKDAPQYTALSYVWGSATPACEVLVDGKALSIRQNLYTCL